MIMATFESRARLLVVGALAFMLGACAEDPREARAQREAKRTSEASQAAAKATAGHMVAAVTSAKNVGQVELKFALASRPRPGEPLVIAFELTPREANTQVRLIVQSADGFEIREGQDGPTVSKAPVGVPIPHQVTVVPLRDGIFTLSAVALFDNEASSVTRSFVIPIIVGEGLTGVAAESTAAITEP